MSETSRETLLPKERLRGRGRLGRRTPRPRCAAPARYPTLFALFGAVAEEELRVAVRSSTSSNSSCAQRVTRHPSRLLHDVREIRERAAALLLPAAELFAFFACGLDDFRRLEAQPDLEARSWAGKGSSRANAARRHIDDLRPMPMPSAGLMRHWGGRLR